MPGLCSRRAIPATFICLQRGKSCKPKTRAHTADQSETHPAALLRSLTSSICTSIPGIKLQSGHLVMYKDLRGDLSEGKQVRA